MSFTVFLSLARDFAIVGALGFIVWKLVDFGEDRIKAQDLKAVQAQIAHNVELQSQWQAKSEAADAQRTQDLADLAARIDANHQPVIVRIAPHPSPVPIAAACPVSPVAASGAADNGSGGDSGPDVRPLINAFELKYETALAGCRAALAQWPVAAVK